MPQEIGHARYVQHRHEHYLARRASAAQVPHAGAGNPVPLRIRNGRDCLVAALFMSSTLPHLGMPGAGQHVPTPRQNARDANAARGVAPIPARPAHVHQPPARGVFGVHAASEAGYSRLATSQTARTLHAIGNTVIGGCATRPAECRKAVWAGFVGAAGTLVAGGLGYLAGLQQSPDCAPTNARPAHAPAQGEALLQLLPDEERQQVWEIIRACKGDPTCTVPEIHAVLERLPASLQRELQQELQRHLQPPAAPEAGGWPPGAWAALLPMDWMDHLAELLGTQITAEEAAFELDVKAIADATVASQEAPGSILQRREAANNARLDVIADRFERDGRNVEVRPFNFTSRTLYSQDYQVTGRNLLVTLSGPPSATADAPVRTLMLLAHGDVAGAEIGSTGSLDNAEGVAALMAVARRFPAGSLPPGTRLQIMITDKEETGLHGAKAFVEECQGAEDCPDAAVNVDMLEGDGLVLSGSDTHVWFRDGDSRPRGADASPVSEAEQALRQMLVSAAADVGVQVHDSRHWALPSDHIAFQRARIPALGFSLTDADDVVRDRIQQHARDAYMRIEEQIDWAQYDAFVEGTLNGTDAQALQQQIDAADSAIEAYQALPISNRERRVHTAADQFDQVNARRSIEGVEILHRAVVAWLNATPAAKTPPRE